MSPIPKDSNMNQSHTSSFHDRKLEFDSPRQPWSGDFDFDGSDRRFAFSRQSSFQQSAEPHTLASILTNDSAKALLTRTVSSIDIPPNIYPQDAFGKLQDSDVKFRVSTSASSVFRGVMSGNKQMRRLFMLISLNVAYSTAELCIGLLSGQVGLVSDAFHLTFGCGLLTFSLFAMAASREKPDRVYTYGYKRLEVLSAFTNALFLLFLSFSLAVEALHAFIQDESEHKHYLIVSAVTNLLVNLIGVWFFRNYARINLVYRKAEDMNYHSVCLHVLADSIRRSDPGFLAVDTWVNFLCFTTIVVFLIFMAIDGPDKEAKLFAGLPVVISFFRVKNAEVLCLGLVSATVFFLVMPLFRATGGILLQMAPPRIPSSALSKCLRQVSSREDVSEVSQARFWELVPGHVIGSILLQVKEGVDDRPILQYVHDLYHELGIQDLTVQIDYT